ncbi:MAG: right-handed parallel beta-helix repeat-containing protein, partial [Bacteroidota bacterium]
MTKSSAALPWTKERPDFRYLSSKVSLPPGKIPRNAQALVVTTIVDTGAGSFRQAILDADSIPGVDLITFDIPGPGVHTIEPIIKLPNITDPVLIDGTSQPGFNGTPLIELSGVNLGGFDALDVFANDCVIKGLVIDRVPAGSGIVLYGDANTIAGNYFGLDPSGTNAPGIAFNGVIVFGLDNRVGGTLTENRNYFAGIGSPAIAISGSVATGNSVEGNYIGTDGTGTVKLGTQTEGVILKTGPWHNTIGGSVAGARNVIAGSSLASGISIVGPGTHGNVVLGNYIGTDPTGLKAFGNSGNGIFLSGADSTVIGGLAFGAGNIICGNGFPGIYIDSTADSTQILGNSIGLGPNGLTPLPNSKGIVINGSSGNRIDGNTIAGNTLHGVEIRNQGATGNILVGNLIGVSPLAGILVGNNGHGVLVNASNNVIGGPNAGDANTIAGNFGAGISVESGQKNLISRNAIYSNYGLGIDLAPGGVNPNDTLDADSGANAMQNYPVLDSLRRRGVSTDVYGHLVTAPDGNFTVEFFADSGDVSHYGQGHRYLGSITAPTGPPGTARFSVSLPAAVSPREVVTATAIDADGNTSEFSRDIGRDYKITNPPQGKLWVVGDVDTIRWEAADTGHVRIEFSSDSGFTYHIITADTDGAAREFPWEVEKARSTRCRIRVSSVDDPSLNGESDYFKVKGVELTRYTADSSYEAFDPAVHGWSFANAANIVWAPAWYNQFDYVNGIDPGTMKQYPAAFTALPVNAKS